MTIFEAVKTTVAPRMAAEHFGLSVSRNGMVCCPFHDDRHPSMKLYEDHYHCFGCQANGDVIAFTSKLFGITPLEAAQKLAADFGIREDRPSVLAKLKMYTTQAENEKLCFRVLSEYLHILQDWKKRYAPQTPEEEPDDRFVENTIPSIPSIPCGIDGRMGWRIFSLPAKEDAMGRIYYKELPLFHLYDSDLTGTHKLLMTLLLVDRYDIYELSCLARMCPEDVTANLAELKRKGYLQDK